MLPGEWSGGIPGVLRHNSREFPTGCCWSPIPQKAAEEVLEAWYYTRHGRRVVLEAWYYTRHCCRSGPGGLVLHQDGWGRSDPRGGNWIPGNSDCIARYNSPRMWRRLAQYQWLLGASISKGSVINTGVGWVTAATGILVYWYTGIQSTQGVITSTLFILS